MSESPVLWRQFSVSNVPLDDEPLWPAQPFSLPIPNLVLRESSSVAELDAFFAIGEAWADLVSHFLPESPVVLDVGCGCGKLARFLYLNPKLRYIGVDLFLPGIEWCRKAFQTLGGNRFRFEHFDGYSPVYNPEGSIKPGEYRLPLENRSIDTVVCASLFTHLLEPDSIHYLREIARVLKPGGRAITSIHTEPVAGTRISGDETRMDIQPEYFVELANETGLHELQTVGLVYGQLVLIFERAG
jgi:SAM-dependent methyltransferase